MSRSSRSTTVQIPTRLRVGALECPWDVDPGEPTRLTWRGTGGEAAAYDVELADVDGGVVWRSEVPVTEASAVVPALVLQAARRYRWRVRPHTAGEPVGPWSAGADFGTGPGVRWRHSTPIWAPAPPADWADYDLVVTLVQGSPPAPGAGPLVGVGMDVPGAHRTGLVFRAPDLHSGYVWTLDAEGGTLEASVRRQGELEILDRVRVPVVPPGTAFEAAIRVRGGEFVTLLDGREVHRWRDGTWATGGVGLAGPPDARSLVHRFAARRPDGVLLVEDDFSRGTSVLAAGAPVGGALQVAERANSLFPTSAEWAFLRGRLDLDESRTVRWATLFVTGASAEVARQFVYRVAVNGVSVGCGPTRSIADETRYDGFDVTAVLRPGANVLAASAWTTRDQRFQAELVVSFTDGSRAVWGTSAGWSALAGDPVYPTAGSVGTGYYSAPVENLQAAAFPVGYTAPGFDDSPWSPAVERREFAQLRPTPTAKVQTREYGPTAVRHLSADTVVLDFGRAHVGGIRMRGTLSRPARIELRFAELLDGDGRARFHLATGNTYRDRWSLTDGRVDASTWGLRVFRYVEIHGLPDDLDTLAVTAVGHVYPLGEPGSFASDDPRLNQVLDLCRTTMISTNLNLLVDSWSREREPYEADAYLQMRCNLTIGDDTAHAAYSLEYLLRRRTWPTEWPFYLVLYAWELFRRSGDDTLVRRHYDTLTALLPTRWLDPSTGLIRKEAGADGSSSRVDHDIVDWPPSERDGYVFGPVNTVVNALSHGAFLAMAGLAEAIGRLTDAAALTARAARLATSMNALLWDSEAQAYRDGLLADGRPIDHHAIHAGAFAAAFGVADPPRLSAVADLIVARGMAASVYAAPFVLDALHAAGRHDDVHALLVDDGPRSWRAMIAAGAGATMESWNESLKPNISCAHPWSASPLYVVAERLVGVVPTTPGYRTFDVRPRLGPLHLARLRLPTPAGVIGVTVRRTDDRLECEIDVPAGTRARFVPPEGDWVCTDALDCLLPAEHLARLPVGVHLITARPAQPIRPEQIP